MPGCLVLTTSIFNRPSVTELRWFGRLPLNTERVSVMLD